MTIKIRNNKAFTLIEVLVAAGVASIVLCSVMYSLIYFSRSFETLGNYTEMNRVSCNAVDEMSQRIRQTRSLKSFSTNSLSFVDQDPNNIITFTYNPQALTLTQSDTNGVKVLLTQCDYLNFSMAQRNPSTNFTFYPATNVNVAKVIFVEWKTSREILQAKVNTENVQTARIVIRN